MACPKFAAFALKGENLSPDNGFLSELKLELAYFSGRAWLKQRGIGAILRFERVRPPRTERFQPLKSREITPDFLDRALGAVRRWGYDIVPMNEVCRRAVTLAGRRRFVCLTFDGGYKDLVRWAHPVLARHDAPFTAYLPTAFPDGVGEAWWLGLEQIIARESRLSLFMDRQERRFEIAGVAEKHQLYRFLFRWMHSLPPPDLSDAIRDLCARYVVDLAALSREASLDWSDVAKLAADPLVTLGCATVNYPVLSNLKDAAALREIAMGKAVAETAFRREVLHFAYPFGDGASWRRKHAVMAKDAGFVSAVTAISGVVEAEGRTNLHELPRIAWDGRQPSLRLMRALLSGSTFPAGGPATPRDA
jgi:peptidoglycan/xylan/chitin deacetylase (PgdA/CDA1 family)